MFAYYNSVLIIQVFTEIQRPRFSFSNNKEELLKVRKIRNKKDIGTWHVYSGGLGGDTVHRMSGPLL